MNRIIPFSVILGIYTYLALRILEWVAHPLDVISFGAAISVAALTGFTWFTVTDWWSTATRPFHPQTVKLETKETPNQVVFAALWAIMNILFVVAVIVLAVLAVRYRWI